MESTRLYDAGNLLSDLPLGRANLRTLEGNCTRDTTAVVLMQKPIRLRKTVGFPQCFYFCVKT